MQAAREEAFDQQKAREAMALALDMGEALTEIRQSVRPDFGDCGAATCEHPGCLYTRKYDALLARLDQLGKEQTSAPPTVPARSPEDDALDALAYASREMPHAPIGRFAADVLAVREALV